MSEKQDIRQTARYITKHEGLDQTEKKMAAILLAVNGADNAKEFVAGIVKMKESKAEGAACAKCGSTNTEIEDVGEEWQYGVCREPNCGVEFLLCGDEQEKSGWNGQKRGEPNFWGYIQPEWQAKL